MPVLIHHQAVPRNYQDSRQLQILLCSVMLDGELTGSIPLAFEGNQICWLALSILLAASDVSDQEVQLTSSEFCTV